MVIKELNLFEFQKYSWEKVFNSLELYDYEKQSDFKIHFERVIQNIWINRYRHIPDDILYNPSNSVDQRFLEVSTLYIKPRNYIGSIEFSFNTFYYRINIFPKIFYLSEYAYKKENFVSIQYNVLWWLSEVTDLLPPSYQHVLSEIDNTNFLDVYIIIFSNFTLNILENDTYKYYNAINEDIQTVKGQINFTRYLNNFTRGNRHIINCDYDDFNEDNSFNQIIKYVCKLLKEYTNNKKIQKNLNNILFILDDVSDVEVSINDCNKVLLNPIFTEYKVILDYCKLFLNGTNSYNRHHEYDVFALIIPTEKLFEKLIRHLCTLMVHDNFNGITTKRPGRSYLANEILPSGEQENRFSVINDIIIKTLDSHILIDTKYKILVESAKDKGISQLDMYQMIGYATSSGINNIKLIYPCTIFKESSIVAEYKVEDLLGRNNLPVKISAFKINIMHEENVNISNTNMPIIEIFRSTKARVINELTNLIGLNYN